MLFNSELALVNRELSKKRPYLEPYMAQHSGQAHWVQILRRRIDRVMNVSLAFSRTSSQCGNGRVCRLSPVLGREWGGGQGRGVASRESPWRGFLTETGSVQGVADVVICPEEGLVLVFNLVPLKSLTSCDGLPLPNFFPRAESLCFSFFIWTPFLVVPWPLPLTFPLGSTFPLSLPHIVGVSVCALGGGDGGLREMVTRRNVAGDSSHPWFFPRSVFPMLISCPTSGRERRAYTPISRWFRPLTNWFEKPSKTGHQRWTRTAFGGWIRHCYESTRRRRACWM